MVKCEICGKEFKDARGLGGHRAAIHEGKAYAGSPTLIHPEKVLEDKAKGIVEVTLADLCEPCRVKIKDKLFPSETLVRVTKEPLPRQEQPLIGFGFPPIPPIPPIPAPKSWWDSGLAEEPSKGSSAVLWLLLGLIVLSRRR